MKRSFTATVWKEGAWYVSQCLEIDVASQGDTEEEALANLKEALELYFEPPHATRPPKLRYIEVEIPVGTLRSILSLSQAHIELDEWETL